MSKELNKVLKKVYYTYKDDNNPPIPIELIKEYLAPEGVNLEDNNKNYNFKLRIFMLERRCLYDR